MTENKRYVRILDYSEKEVRIFDEHNQKNIFNIFFMELDSAICLKGALEDTVDLLNELHERNHLLLKASEKDSELIKTLREGIHQWKKENVQLKQSYKEFGDECQSTFNAMSRKQNDLYRKNFKLKEENEQLKQRIKELEIENTAQSDAIDGLQATLTHFDLEEVIK